MVERWQVAFSILIMKFMMGILVLSVLLCVPGGVVAQVTCVPVKNAKLPRVLDLTYHKARPKLLAAGWQPFRTIHHNSADTDTNTRFGNGEEFWKKGYREIENCAGTGLAPCSFLFEDVYGNRLRVTTAGEEIPKQRSFARVTGYKFVCGD